jgi:hypothetical protein
MKYGPITILVSIYWSDLYHRNIIWSLQKKSLKYVLALPKFQNLSKLTTMRAMKFKKKNIVRNKYVNFFINETSTKFAEIRQKSNFLFFLLSLQYTYVYTTWMYIKIPMKEKWFISCSWFILHWLKFPEKWVLPTRETINFL